MPKKPWQSKTNVIFGVLGLLSFVALFLPQANEATAWLNANGAIVGAVWSGLAIVLRFITKDKIQLFD